MSTMNEREARVALSTLIEPGDATMHRLIAEQGSAHNAYLEITMNQDRYQTWASRLNDSNIIRALELCTRHDITIVIPGDANWPTQLDDLGDRAPIVLYVRGDTQDLQRSMVAIVGARAATAYGEHVTGELAGELAQRGWTIVSGGAYGIDGMAHRAALAQGGRTVAVLAGGVDRYYPGGNQHLFDSIVERGGSVVAEVPPGSTPTKYRFLQRNRLIAALSRGLVVVEAGVRSGSLNAVGHAHDLGRPLMAVPGPLTSPASVGCHQIIANGKAVLIGDASDIERHTGTAVIVPPAERKLEVTITRVQTSTLSVPADYDIDAAELDDDMLDELADLEDHDTTTENIELEWSE